MSHDTLISGIRLRFVTHTRVNVFMYTKTTFLISQSHTVHNILTLGTLENVIQTRLHEMEEVPITLHNPWVGLANIIAM